MRTLRLGVLFFISVAFSSIYFVVCLGSVMAEVVAVLLTSNDILPLKLSAVVSRIPALPLLSPAAVRGGGVLSSFFSFLQEGKRNIPSDRQMTVIRFAFIIFVFIAWFVPVAVLPLCGNSLLRTAPPPSGKQDATEAFVYSCCSTYKSTIQAALFTLLYPLQKHHRIRNAGKECCTILPLINCGALSI